MDGWCLFQIVYVTMYDVHAYMGPIELFSLSLCSPASPSLSQTLRHPLAYLFVCLTRSPHAGPHLLTCSCWAGSGNACAPTASKQPSVQVEHSLYKRHPSASLQWFLFAVHLSSVCVFFPSVSLSVCGQFRPSKQNMKNTGIEMTWLLSIEMQSSLWWVLVLYFMAISLLCQHLLLQIPGSKIIKKLWRYS